LRLDRLLPTPQLTLSTIHQKAFMAMRLIASEVANPVTLDSIYPIILEFRRVKRFYLKFLFTCFLPTQGA
jgi:hypothetical protein